MLSLIISNIYQIRKKNLLYLDWRNSILKYRNKIHFKHKNFFFIMYTQSPHNMVSTNANFHLPKFQLMYALVGEFSVSWNIRTVPLTQVSHKAFFSRSQNARKLGNRGRSHILQASVEIRSHRNFYTLLLLDI